MDDDFTTRRGEAGEGLVGKQTPDEEPRIIVGLEWSRFYVATIFSLLSVLQGAVWSQMSAFSGTLRDELNIPGSMIDHITSLGTASQIPTLLLTGYFIRRSELHNAIRGSIIAVLAGSVAMGLSIVLNRPWLLYIGAFFNGLGGGAAMSAGATISDWWFAANERTVATAIMTGSNPTGFAFSFIAAAVWVKSRRDVVLYCVCESIVALVLTLACLLYLPNQPLQSPSLSRWKKIHSSDRAVNSFQFLKSSVFWRIALSYALVSGIYNGWLSVLPLNLHDLGIDQGGAGFVAFTGVVSGVAGGIVGSYIVDSTSLSLQFITLLMTTSAMATFAVFALLGGRIIEIGTSNLTLLIVLSAIGGAGVNGSVPILIELAIETSFGHSSAEMVAGFMVLMQNIAVVAFLVIPLDDFGTRWMDWALVGSLSASCLLLLCGRMDCKRIECDLGRGLLDLTEESESIVHQSRQPFHYW